MIDLTVRIAGVTLQNPVIPASGTCELVGQDKHRRFIDPGILGAVINKTIFQKPRPGNPPPRIVETPCGLLNAIGIPSEGLDSFLEEQLPLLHSFGPPVIASIAGNSIEEWRLLAERICATGQADLLELDLSCPNLKDGIPWATDPGNLGTVVAEVCKATSVPVIAKLSPSVRDIAAMGEVAEQSGAAALSLVNTFPGMVIDIDNRRPVLGNLTGGLSGPAIRPLAVRAVYETYRQVDIPIIGMGGISRWQNAVEFLLAGATAVAVGTANFINPLTMSEVIEGLAEYLQRHGYESIREIIGLAHRPASQIGSF